MGQYIDRKNKIIYEFSPLENDPTIFNYTSTIRFKDNNILNFYSPLENNHIEIYFKRCSNTKKYLDEDIRIPDDNPVEPILFNNMKTDTSLQISDYSLLYSLYFLICMSSNVPDENGYPLNMKGENVFKEFFDPLLLDYEHFHKEVGNVDNKPGTKKYKVDPKYIKHVRNISEQISKLLFDME